DQKREAGGAGGEEDQARRLGGRDEEAADLAGGEVRRVNVQVRGPRGHRRGQRGLGARGRAAVGRDVGGVVGGELGQVQRVVVGPGRHAEREAGEGRRRGGDPRRPRPGRGRRRVDVRGG